MHFGETPQKRPDIEVEELENESIVHEKNDSELNDQVRMVANAISAYDRGRSLNMLELQIPAYKLNFLGKYNYSDLKELYSKLSRLSNEMINHFIFGVEGHDSKRSELERAERMSPRLFEVYKSILTDLLNIESEAIQGIFDNHLEGREVDQELLERINERTIILGEPLSQEKRDQLKKDFPSGNFGFHSADLENTLQIIESGNILTSAEVASRKNLRRWGHGGSVGISLNLNGVRVLRGSRKHLTGFLMDPLTILNEDNKLSVFGPAAVNEVQLVPHSFNSRDDSNTYDHQNVMGNFEDQLPRIDVSDTYVVCNKGDLDNIKKILAMNGVLPKGVIAYPTVELRSQSWLEPRGDYKSANVLFRELLDEASIHPTINWERDLFSEKPVIMQETMIDPNYTPFGFSIVKNNNKLLIDRGY